MKKYNTCVKLIVTAVQEILQSSPSRHVNQLPHACNFQALPKENYAKCEAGSKLENRTKNRFANIKPCMLHSDYCCFKLAEDVKNS